MFGHLCPGLLSLVLGPSLPEIASLGSTQLRPGSHTPWSSPSWGLSLVLCKVEGPREGGRWDVQVGLRRVFHQWDPRKGV